MSGVQTTFGGVCGAKKGGLALHFGLESAVNDFFSDIPSPAEASYYDEYGAAASAVIESAVDIKVPIRTADKGQ